MLTRLIEKIKGSSYIKDLGERMGKTFAQFYFAYWLFLNPTVSESSSMVSPDAFDTLFTTNNLKAGVVGAALSIATSLGSRYVGKKDSASLVE